MFSLGFTPLRSMQHVPLKSNPSRCVPRVPYARTTHNEKILVLWICLGAIGYLHYTIPYSANSQPAAFLNSSDRTGTATEEQLRRDEITATVPAGWQLECSTYPLRTALKSVAALQHVAPLRHVLAEMALNHCRSTCFTEVNAVSCVGCGERDGCGCGWA